MHYQENPQTGRPNKFTEEVKEKILHAISKGATYEIACNYARVSESVFYEWKQKAKQGDERFAEFMEKIKAVESEAALKWLEKIDNAAETQWQAAGWKLERRHYKSYSANPMVREELKALEDKLEQILKKQKEINNGSEAKKDRQVDQESD